VGTGHAGRLFNAIVVVGSALGGNGCLGRVQDAGTRENATDGGPNDGAQLPGDTAPPHVGGDSGMFFQPPSPDQCGHPAEFTCDSYKGSWYMNCRCVAEAPRDPSDCEDPRQFICRTTSGWGCQCAATTPLTPAACEHPQQFLCQEYSGMNGPVGCVCDPDAPLAPTDCTNNTAEWTCFSYDPPTGCQCVRTIILP
jgi:hypothetical protein